jgi:hypothetical protein
MSTEFGSDFIVPAAGQLLPAVFAEASGGFNATAISDAVPNGTTWLLLGVDFYGQVSATQGIQFTLTGPAGSVVWSASVQAESANQQLYQGFQWRGQIPYGRGQVIEASAFASADPVAFGVICWGVVLPYDVF